MIGDFKYGAAVEAATYRQRLVKRTELEYYAIDTAYTTDCGYETAVAMLGMFGRGRPWRIVEYYSTREEAAKGHGKWVKFCKTNNPTSVYDVQLQQEVKL